MAASLVGKAPREPVPTVTPQASEDAVAAGGSWERLDALLEDLSARHAPDLQGHRERKQHSLLQLELLTAPGSEAAWEARLAAFEEWLRDPENAAPGARERNLERVATRIEPILGHVLDDMLELHQEARVQATGLRFDNDLFLAADQIEPVLSAWSTLQAMVEGVLARTPIPDRPADDWRYAALSQLALPIRWGASARLAEVVPKLVDPRSPSVAPRPLFEAVQHLMLHRDLDLFVTCRARAAAVETLIDDLGLERGGKAPLDPDRVMRTLGLVMRSAMNCRDRREDLVHPQLLRVASLLEAPEAAGLRSALRGRAFDSWVEREEKFAAAFLESAPDTGILWKSLLRVVRGGT